MGQNIYVQVMETVRMWMIHFNDTRTFSDAFRNINWHLSEISCEFELFFVF